MMPDSAILDCPHHRPLDLVNSFARYFRLLYMMYPPTATWERKANSRYPSISFKAGFMARAWPYALKASGLTKTKRLPSMCVIKRAMRRTAVRVIDDFASQAKMDLKMTKNTAPRTLGSAITNGT